MKSMNYNNIAEDKYSAPRCRVFTVEAESYIAQSPGNPGDDDDYDDLGDY